MKRTLWLLLFFAAAGAFAQTQDVAIQDVSVNAQTAAATSGFISGLSISNNMTALFTIGGNPCALPTCTLSFDAVNTTGGLVYGTPSGAPTPAAFISLISNPALLGTASATDAGLYVQGGAGIWQTIAGLSADTTPSSSAVVRANDGGADKKYTLQTIVKQGVNGGTIDNAPDATADYIPFYDTSASTLDKALAGAVGGDKIVRGTIGTPGAAEVVIFGFTPVAATVKAAGCALIGSSTPSVTFNWKYGTDLSSLTGVTTSPAATTSVTTISGHTINNTAVSANSFFVLTTSAQSGTVTQGFCYLSYTTP